MSYELTQKPAFFDDLIQLPKSEHKKVSRAIERLVDDPFGGKTKRICRQSYKNLYRYRTDSQRILFVVGTQTVCLLGVRNRSEAYDRFRPGNALEAVAAYRRDGPEAAQRHHGPQLAQYRRALESTTQQPVTAALCLLRTGQLVPLTGEAEAVP